jgi:hypothetical protein
MKLTSRLLVFPLAALVCLGLFTGCNDSGHSLGKSHPNDGGTGGLAQTGGELGSGGATGIGGVTGSGGASGSGGLVSTGGAAGSGGSVGSGGLVSTGGVTSSGVGGTAVGGSSGGTGGAIRDAGALIDARADSSFAADVTIAPDAAKDVATADGSVSPPCPQAAPASGSACIAGQSACFYEDCSNGGRTQATCTAGQWAIETGACGTVSCQGVSVSGSGRTCASGQVCLVHAGGALLVSCIANECGTGPASPDCSTFTTQCTPYFSITSGITYYCNSCADPPCA